MARGDGIHRTSARNARMKDADIGNTQAHNEREKSSYVNQDIVPERTPYNVHFKTPTAGYKEMFEQMRSDGVISTRGLKADAEKFGEELFQKALVHGDDVILGHKGHFKVDLCEFRLSVCS